jgi:hypothetical protein
MKKIVCAMMVIATMFLTSCEPAPKDEHGNLSNYQVLGNFKGNTLYQVDRGYGNAMIIAVRNTDSAITSMTYRSGKISDHVIIIDNDTVSAEEAVKLLSKE